MNTERPPSNIIFVPMPRYAHDTVVPFEDSRLSKKEQVSEMFDDISGKYDLLNRMLSAGIDVKWRKKALRELKNIHPKNMLDVATGTGDVAIMACRELQPDKITGIDISEGMMNKGRKKIADLRLQNKITLEYGDSEELRYADDSFDAVTVAFGVRNFQNLEKGLQEMRRVLRRGGRIVILEFSKPTGWLTGTLYDLYMKTITPLMGKIFSGNKKAYSYLDKSIKKFPEGKNFLKILSDSGFNATYCKKLTLGICTIYCGTK